MHFKCIKESRKYSTCPTHLEFESQGDFETSGLDEVNVNLLSPYLRFEVSKQKQLHSSFFSVSYEKNVDTSDDDPDEDNSGSGSGSDDEPDEDNSGSGSS